MSDEIKKIQELKNKLKYAMMDMDRAQRLAKMGSWRHHHRNKKLTWSDETYRIFEIEKEDAGEIEFNYFFKYVHPDEKKSVWLAYQSHIRHHTPYQVVHKLVLADGQVKYIDSRCETTFDESGKAIVSNGTVQDITEHKLTELALIEKEQQLIQQSRLAQMGEMISMIAHQWRQPLTAISASTNNLSLKLMLGDVDTEEFKKEIALIDDYSQHLSTTINDFRNFFKENKEKESTTLEEIVQSTLGIVEMSTKNKGIAITTKLECSSPLETYVSELKQVVLNLIKNAEDILLEKEIDDPKITLATSCDQNGHVVQVKDNAGGVPEVIKEKIFDPYFSTKLEKDGTGLGLYMSKTIIEDHCKGRLSVENDNEGAVFTVWLP
jgi:signal transduction histidine kinase